MEQQDVPPIVAGRFGLEQRCAYRHPDLYDEEVPEVDLENVVSRPDLGAGCAVRTFLLLGDQNAGKSTMLHSFCRYGDPDFMQLSSLLPVLASSFINTRLVPTSFLGDDTDPNQQLSSIRDEMPFMDTDIARGVVMLTLENFRFFCHEFGILSGPALEADEGVVGLGEADVGEEMRSGDFCDETRFVALQFVELGGDHLDRLLRFHAAGGDLDAVRRAECSTTGQEEQAFWSDVHEVLMGSMRLLKDTSRSVYFINCAFLLGDGSLNPAALRSMLKKLRFLDNVLGGGKSPNEPSSEVVFYCSRCSEVDPAAFDAAAAWTAARAEAAAFAREELRAAAVAQRLPAAPPEEAAGWDVSDEGLDLSALEDVAGSGAHEWRAAEARAAPVLAFIREALLGLVLPALRARLRVCGVYAVRNLADTAVAPRSEDAYGRLCVPSIVRNVARLLQQRVFGAQAGGSAELLPHVAEVVLRCAADLRRVVAPSAADPAATLVGRWVTCSDLAGHLEECEGSHQAVPLPEVAVLQGWAGAAAALVGSGACVQLAPGAPGLPRVTLELFAQSAGHDSESPVVRLSPSCDGDGGTGAGAADVLFVTSLSSGAGGAARASAAAEAVGLPLDADFFALMSSDSAIQSVSAHLCRGGAGAFSFSAPRAVAQLEAIHARLAAELDALAAEVAATAVRGSVPPGVLGRLLHAAGDVWQARTLLGLASGAHGPVEPSAKRACVGAALERLAPLAASLAAAAAAEGVTVELVRVPPGAEGPPSVAGPLLRVRLPP